MFRILFRSLIVFTLSFGMVSSFLWAGGKSREESAVKRSWRAQRVVAPTSRPVYSNESINIAMAMYGIDIPSNAEQPVFDPKLSDRGLTIKRAWHRNAEVKIGSAAFSSWSLLGSTLAHELEIHCRQNFFMISLLDRLGFDGTSVAERQAYKHELIMANRFGLSKADRTFIADTVHYYYPLNTKSKTSMASRLNSSFESILLARPGISNRKK